MSFPCQEPQSYHELFGPSLMCSRTTLSQASRCPTRGICTHFPAPSRPHLIPMSRRHACAWGQGRTKSSQLAKPILPRSAAGVSCLLTYNHVPGFGTTADRRLSRLKPRSHNRAPFLTSLSRAPPRRLAEARKTIESRFRPSAPLITEASSPCRSHYHRAAPSCL